MHLTVASYLPPPGGVTGHHTLSPAPTISGTVLAAIPPSTPFGRLVIARMRRTFWPMPAMKLYPSKPTFPHSTRPLSSSARRASRTRRIRSTRLTSATSRLSIVTPKNPTKVALLMLAKVSHKACSTTAVKKAPRTRQFRVACPTLSLSPKDSTYQPRPSYVAGRRGQAAHQEYLIQDPEVTLGGEQGDEPVAHRLQSSKARRGSNTQDYASRLRSVAPYEVEDERHNQLGQLLYETDEQLGQKA